MCDLEFSYRPGSWALTSSQLDTHFAKLFQNPPINDEIIDRTHYMTLKLQTWVLGATHRPNEIHIYVSSFQNLSINDNVMDQTLSSEERTDGIKKV